ncbi:MAG: TRAP transporter large permease subunit [Chitinivibrionales bacterium]|nr:TRAP transporter large permease subunit [Chitinivibrionales bacterium]MBD3397060.1 TRAP transporter large permease subunit [Chitinivibrionales bacterium]
MLSSRARAWLTRLESGIAIACLALISLFPIAEVVARRFRTGVPGSTDYIYHLVLWITFVGGMITSREDKHLSLSVGLELMQEPFRSWIQAFTSCLSTAVCASLAWSSFYFIRVGIDASRSVGALPRQAVLMIMPVGFAVMCLRFVLRAPRGWVFKIIAASGIGIAALLGYPLFDYTHLFVWPLSILLAASAAVGTPIFVVLGGLAALLFLNTGGTIAVIPNEAYTMLTGPIIPTIPLFTLAGFILSESKAGERLVRLFRALFGWLPGGLAIMTILICTFFTALTGASGVTILALGGLLSFVLIQNKYEKDFATGLLTVNGIGSLFPPSLPIIMYGVVAQINIKKMFVAVLIPCAIMVLGLVVLAVYTASRKKIQRIPFDAGEAGRSLKESFWEILIPAIILVSYFGGITTLVETGAVTVLYVTIVEVLIHRDMKAPEFANAFLKSIPIMGGVLVILAVAKGLSYFIVDAEIPMKLAEWLQAYISSKYVFLILLNIALLIIGCLMDVFSAIIVVVPLLIPLAHVYGINPIHLGIIFLANLEIGFLTPPVGINLFLASYRFNMPLVRVYRDVIPFFLTMIATLILITYVPVFSTFLVEIFFP